MALEVARLRIRELRPHLLERPHLFPGDRLCSTSRRLEDIRKILDDHTSKHVHEDVLLKVVSWIDERAKVRLTMLRRFHAMNSPNAQAVLPQSERLRDVEEFVQRG